MARQWNRLGLAAVSVVAGWSSSALAGTATFVGPTPYLCIEDSPFDISGLGVTFFLEDVEDGVNTPGLSIVGGSPTGPGGITDSVDCDDGVIDNNGQMGKSLFGGGQAGITMNFNARALGALPTSAGVVWTDGGATNTVTLEAFDENGVSLGTLVGENIGDGGFSSDTAEDRFFGVHYEGGISKIYMNLIPMGGGSGIEIDHIQYGAAGFAEPDPCLPDLNDDGFVDGADLGLLLSVWGTTGGNADLTEDGTVDGADLGLLLAAWGDCPD
jgi:hypothetical protein